MTHVVVVACMIVLLDAGVVLAGPPKEIYKHFRTPDLTLRRNCASAHLKP